MGIKQRTLRAIADNVYSRVNANLPVCIVSDGQKGAPLTREQASGFLNGIEFVLRNVNLDKDSIPEDLQEELSLDEEEEPAPKKKSKKDKGGKKGKKKSQDIDD